MMIKSEYFYLRWGYIDIEWYTGSMTIILDKFFPCTMAKYRLLLKTIALDYANEAMIRNILKSYFQNKILKLPEEAEAKMKEADQAKALARQAKKQYYANRELHYYNIWQNNKYMAQEYKREAQRIIKSKPTFEKYIELL